MEMSMTEFELKAIAILIESAADLGIAIRITHDGFEYTNPGNGYVSRLPDTAMLAIFVAGLALGRWLEHIDTKETIQ